MILKIYVISMAMSFRIILSSYLDMKTISKHGKYTKYEKYVKYFQNTRILVDQNPDELHAKNVAS